MSEPMLGPAEMVRTEKGFIVFGPLEEGPHEEALDEPPELRFLPRQRCIVQILGVDDVAEETAKSIAAAFALPFPSFEEDQDDEVDEQASEVDENVSADTKDPLGSPEEPSVLAKIARLWRSCPELQPVVDGMRLELSVSSPTGKAGSNWRLVGPDGTHPCGTQCAEALIRDRMFCFVTQREVEEELDEGSLLKAAYRQCCEELGVEP
jgi:hypothetical protein